MSNPTFDPTSINFTRGKYILDENDEPIECHDLLTWGQWLEDIKNSGKRIVQKTYFGQEGQEPFVSTVFLAMDHGFAAYQHEVPQDYKPILWETLVFGGKMDGYMDRYSSKRKAILGHKRICKKMKAIYTDR